MIFLFSVSYSGGGWVFSETVNGNIDQRCIYDESGNGTVTKEECIVNGVKGEIAKLHFSTTDPDFVKLGRMFSSYGLKTFDETYYVDLEDEAIEQKDKFIEKSMHVLQASPKYTMISSRVLGIITDDDDIDTIKFVIRYREYNDIINSTKDTNLVSIAKRCNGNSVPNILRGGWGSRMCRLIEKGSTKLNLLYLSYEYKSEDDIIDENESIYTKSTDHTNGIFLDHTRKIICHIEPHCISNKADIPGVLKQVFSKYLEKGYTFYSTTEIKDTGLQNNRYDQGFCVTWTTMCLYLIFINKHLSPVTIINVLALLPEEQSIFMLMLYVKYTMDYLMHFASKDSYKSVVRLYKTMIVKGITNLNDDKEIYYNSEPAKVEGSVALKGLDYIYDKVIPNAMEMLHNQFFQTIYDENAIISYCVMFADKLLSNEVDEYLLDYIMNGVAKMEYGSGASCTLL